MVLLGFEGHICGSLEDMLGSDVEGCGEVARGESSDRTGLPSGGCDSNLVDLSLFCEEAVLEK